MNQPQSVSSQPIPSDKHGQILVRMEQLRPWRMNIQITPEISTGQYVERESETSAEIKVGKQKENVYRCRDRSQFLALLDQLYPDSMVDRRLLDCGCNAGGHCFWARERNAEIAFGFDIREHWIKQARFLKNHRTVGLNDYIQFEIFDLQDLPTKELHPFDLVLFKGLFFLLSDPISGLTIAADHSRDLLIFSTACHWGLSDGSLKAVTADQQPLHGGTERLNWMPTGPRVCAELLQHLGFEELKLTTFRQSRRYPTRGRLQIVAAREQGRLRDLEGEQL